MTSTFRANGNILKCKKNGVLGENALVFGFISKIRRLKNTAVQQVDFTLKI